MFIVTFSQRISKGNDDYLQCLFYALTVESGFLVKCDAAGKPDQQEGNELSNTGATEMPELTPFLIAFPFHILLIPFMLLLVTLVHS